MQPKENPTYGSLFRTFFWLGLTAFGGPAMTAHIRKQIVEKKQWMDGAAYDTGLALCQIIPGAIVMQLVAYIGLKLKGIPAAVISFIAFGLPAFLIMFLLSALYKHSSDIGHVEKILGGLRVIIIAIVANAAYTFGTKNFRTWHDWVIASVAAGLFLTKLYPALVLLTGSLLGVLLTNKEYIRPMKLESVNTFRFFLWALASVVAGLGLIFIIDKNYFDLSTIMLRIDLISFGGGLASMPMMYHELVDLFGWFSKRVFMDGVILGQVTPGSIIIAATFFGYMHFGIFGSLLATLAVFTPSFLILMGVIPFFDKLSSYPQFQKVVNGILCSFVGLLVVVTYRFGFEVHWNIITILTVLISFILLIKNVSVIWIIIAGIILSMII
jgi:chromate transporter